MKATVAFLGILASSIWFYLLYQILQMVHASDLMWFLYWIYVPVSLVVSYLIRHLQDEAK
jgi:hypothetical protein